MNKNICNFLKSDVATVTVYCYSLINVVDMQKRVWWMVAFCQVRKIRHKWLDHVDETEYAAAMRRIWTQKWTGNSDNV